MNWAALRKNRKTLFFWGKVIFATLLAVFLVRTFLTESYTISSRQMESSLWDGDRVFVDKMAYGIRMPVTILSIPFAFDSILGMKSYSSSWQLSYKRVFEKPVKRNDIVLFNNPLEKEIPLDRRTLLVSRCIGLPGDTLTAKEYGYLINGEEYVLSPGFVSEYTFFPADFAKIRESARRHAIALKDVKQRETKGAVRLSRSDAYLINQYLDRERQLCPITVNSFEYVIVIPQKGTKILLTPENLLRYGQIILEESGSEGEIRNGKLYFDSLPQDSHVFEEDYYWMLSDNSDNNTDSNAVGFVSFRDVIGKLRFVWYNPEKEDRSFQAIN